MRVAAEESNVVAAEPAQLFRDPLRRAPAVRVVRGEGRDGRNAEKRRELGEQPRVIHGANNLDGATSASQRYRQGELSPMRTTAAYDLFPDAPSERAMARAA